MKALLDALAAVTTAMMHPTALIMSLRHPLELLITELITAAREAALLGQTLPALEQEDQRTQLQHTRKSNNYLWYGLMKASSLYF